MAPNAHPTCHLCPCSSPPCLSFRICRTAVLWYRWAVEVLQHASGGLRKEKVENPYSTAREQHITFFITTPQVFEDCYQIP